MDHHRNQQEMCRSCNHNCRFFHSHRTSTTSSPNSFYKLILRQNDLQLLYLPPKLNPILSTLVDKKINLEDSAGRRSVVTISEDDGSLAFKEGWDVFSKEHGLEIGDFLVFNCIKKLDIDVKIYDNSACERLDFSKKLNRRKRDRSGKFVRQIENISENDNDDGRVQSMCTSEHVEDTCYITSHTYENDAANFNEDPMLEEVLGSGDTSYAAKLKLLGRNSSLGETAKVAYDDSSALTHGQNKELLSIMFDREVQECQFVESLGSDEAEISKGENPSNVLELEISGRNNFLADLDKGTHDKTPPLELEENKKGKSIMSKKEIQECQFDEGLGLFLGSDLAEISKGENPSNVLELEISGRNNSLADFDKGTHDMTPPLELEENKKGESIMSKKEIQECQFDKGLGELNEVPVNMTPKMCSLTDILHATELAESPKVIKGEFNQDNKSLFETSGRKNSVGDSGKGAYDKTSTLKLEADKERKFIMSDTEIQECLFAEGLGSDPAAEERCNEIRNLLNAQIHIGEMNEVPMNTTSKIGSFNDKLHATELPKVVKREFNRDNERHFETAATVSSVVLTDNDHLEFNEISNPLHDQTHLGEMKEVPVETTPKLDSINDKLNATGSQEVIEGEFSEDETAETVTCVVLTVNHYLELSTCLSLSRAGLAMNRLVVFLRDPLRRLWPVLYLNKTWLTSGWSDFRRANNIKLGDVCVFRVLNKYERIISVHIEHK